MPQPALEAYPVSRRIASRTVDDYALLEPVVPGEETLPADPDASYDEDE